MVRRMTTKEIETAIGRGALYADIHHPKWGANVKIEKIDTAKIESSLMAQLRGADWDEEFSYREAIEYGFILPPDATPAEHEYANKIWRMETRRRRPARVGRPPKTAPKAEETDE